MKKQYLLSFVLFLFFFTYRIYFWDESGAELFNIISNATVDTIASIICGYLLFKKADFGNRKSIQLIYSLLIAIIILGISLGSLWLLHKTIYTLSGSLDGPFRNTFELFSFQIFDLFTVLFIGTVIVYAYLKNKSLAERESKIASLEEERKKAEMDFLRSQMDPHFIFNSLNTILYTIDEKNKSAQDLVVKFSELIRFHLYDFQDKYIPLEKEVEFIYNYISIMKIRREDHQEVQFEIIGNIENTMVPPLLLIPIVENSFKHAGNLSQKKSLIDIKLIVEKGFLSIISKNPKKDVMEKEAEIAEPKGIGLKNIEKRLQLLFNDDYELKVEQNDKTFQLQLKVPLNYESVYT